MPPIDTPRPGPFRLETATLSLSAVAGAAVLLGGYFYTQLVSANRDTATRGSLYVKALSQYHGTSYKFIQAGTPASSDKTHTWPNVTGNVAVGTSISDGYAPKFSGTAGNITSSSAWFDGTTLTNEGGIIANGPISCDGYTLDTSAIHTGRTAVTATSGGTYTVLDTDCVILVNASALTAGQNYTVMLQAPTNESGKHVWVKIVSQGAASSTVTIDASSGNVEGAATHVVTSDGSNLAARQFFSDTANCHLISSYL